MSSRPLTKYVGADIRLGQVHVELCLLQHHLSHSQNKAAHDMLEKASERLSKVDHQPEGQVAGLRLRYEVLRACLHVGEGNLDALSTTGEV